MKKLALTFACFGFTSCFMDNNSITLPGKILIFHRNHECSIYNNSDTSKIKFKLPDEKWVAYGRPRWANKSDKVFAGEYLKAEETGTYQGNIVCLDLSGNIIERIYQSKSGEIAGDIYPSKNDKLLLFATHKKSDPRVTPFDGLVPMQSLLIMDLDSKEILRKISDIGRSPNFQLDESPWLNDGSGFVYSLSSENKIVSEGDTLNSLNNGEGIYLYDLATNRQKLIVPAGRFAICSPVNRNMAYLKDGSVWLCDLSNNSKRLLFKARPDVKVSNIHWTPDGKYIYLVYFDYYAPELFTSTEKLIESGSGIEAPFKKIGHGFGTYSWK